MEYILVSTEKKNHPLTWFRKREAPSKTRRMNEQTLCLSHSQQASRILSLPVEPVSSSSNLPLQSQQKPAVLCGGSAAAGSFVMSFRLIDCQKRQEIWEFVCCSWMTSFYGGVGGWQGQTAWQGSSPPAESAAVTLQARNHTHTHTQDDCIIRVLFSAFMRFSREETERTRREY